MMADRNWISTAKKRPAKRAAAGRYRFDPVEAAKDDQSELASASACAVERAADEVMARV